MLGLELADVVDEHLHHALGVLRRQDDARAHLGLGGTGHHLDEVEDEFGLAVGDHGEVGIHAAGDLFGQFDVEFGLLAPVVLAHGCKVTEPTGSAQGRTANNSPRVRTDASAGESDGVWPFGAK